MNGEMYWAAKTCYDDDIRQASSARGLHLRKVTRQETQTWGKCFRRNIRKLGIVAASAVLATGLTGFGEKQAQAGILMHAATPAEYYEQVGAQFSGVFTGTSGGTIGLKFVYDRPGVGQVTRIVPGGLSTESTIFVAGHSLSNILELNPILTVFLGNDANNPIKTSAVTNIQFHPDYIASGFNGATSPDIFKATLVDPFVGSLPMTFASAIPDAGTTARWAGFGFQATPAGVQLGQSGKLTGGEVRLSSISPTEGGNPESKVTFTNQSTPGHYNPYFNDSGSRLVDNDFRTFGMYLRAGVSTSSGYAEFMDLSQGSIAHTFIASTSVPEPGSFALLSIIGLAVGAGYRLRK